MRSVASVAVALFGLCALAACGGGNGADRPTPTKPAEYTFNELWERKNSNDFSVLLEGEIAGFKGELLWRKQGDVERWDFFTELQRGDRPYAGESSIGDQHDIKQSCNWVFETKETVSYDCTSSPILTSLREQFIAPFFRYGFLEGTEGEILGRRVSCFEYGVRLRRYAHICLDDNGVPLRLNVGWSIDGPMDVTAREIRPPQTDDLERLPLDVRTPTSLPIAVAVDDLTLPELPSLAEYLSQD